MSTRGQTEWYEQACSRLQIVEKRTYLIELDENGSAYDEGLLWKWDYISSPWMERDCWGSLRDMRADTEIGSPIWRRHLRCEMAAAKTGTEKPVIPMGSHWLLKRRFTLFQAQVRSEAVPDRQDRR